VLDVGQHLGERRQHLVRRSVGQQHEQSHDRAHDIGFDPPPEQGAAATDPPFRGWGC
jgi:hypothetical protein